MMTRYIQKNGFFFYFLFTEMLDNDTIAYAYNACLIYSLVAMFIPRTLMMNDLYAYSQSPLNPYPSVTTLSYGLSGIMGFEDVTMP